MGQFLDWIKNKGFLSSPISVVDVGCSGGFDPIWKNLGDQFRGIGFDILKNEVDRLNNLKEPNREYRCVEVGSSKYRENHMKNYCRYIHDSEWLPYWRSNFRLALKESRFHFEKDNFNSGQKMEVTEEFTELDGALNGNPVNFLKIDTDGSDYSVLLGAEQLLGSPSLLGIKVECQFHGLASGEANLFHNIDKLLRNKGFRLFHLEPQKYSRAALPQEFVYSFPAQTFKGQTIWADAIYFRDPLDPTVEPAPTLMPDLRVKLFCLYNLFDLNDSAAELILKSDSSDLPFPATKALDILTRETSGLEITHHDYLELCKEAYRTKEWNAIHHLRKEEFHQFLNNKPTHFFEFAYHLKVGYSNIQNHGAAIVHKDDLIHINSSDLQWAYCFKIKLNQHSASAKDPASSQDAFFERQKRKIRKLIQFAQKTVRLLNPFCRNRLISLLYRILHKKERETTIGNIIVHVTGELRKGAIGVSGVQNGGSLSQEQYISTRGPFDQILNFDGTALESVLFRNVSDAGSSQILIKTISIYSVSKKPESSATIK